MSRLTHKQGRPSKYRKSLQSNPYWEEVKFRIRCRDGHRCRICGKKYDLEVHHIKYKKNGLSIIGKELENLDCLILVCEDCHKAIHGDLSNKLNPYNKINK